eukprot:15323956-Heterocapsa_arctica.AAC.1
MIQFSVADHAVVAEVVVELIAEVHTFATPGRASEPLLTDVQRLHLALVALGLDVQELVTELLPSSSAPLHRLLPQELLKINNFL